MYRILAINPGSSSTKIACYRDETLIFEKNVPLKLSVTFFYAIKQENRWWQWKTSRPDLDNLMKNLQDYMTKLCYYSDDSQIVWLEAKKVNDEKNRIEIEITEV